MTLSKPRIAPRFGALAGAALMGGLVFAAAPAQAWWRGGVWVGLPPVVVAPPAPYYPYYYPPAYYPPYPPGYYAPPQAAYTPVPPQAAGQTQVPATDSQPVAYGATCYAGVYVCPSQPNSAVGSGCTCPGIGAPSYGSVR